MDSLLQLQVMASLTAIAFTCIWWVATAVRRRKNKHREAPEPPGALPLIGHLHLLGKAAYPPRALGALADKHGPVFTLRLGSYRTLVVSSCAAARECFATNDAALSSRPRTAVGKHIAYDHAMLGFAPYGPYWRSVRKIAHAELLSNARVAAFEQVRSMEISVRIREVYELWEKKGRRPVVVDMKRLFKDLAFGIIVRVVAGKQYPCAGSDGVPGEVKRLKRGMEEFTRLISAFVVSDFLPFLGWMDLGGHEKAMKCAARDLDAVIAAWVEEHRRRRSAGLLPEGDGDFMDVLLSAMDGPEFSEMDADEVVKANCLSMILGASDTTVFSLMENFAMLANYPEVLRKAREELDLHVGRQRNVEEADVKNLVYLQAVVKETFRLHPIAPFLQAREVTKDCNIAGFHVPAGTRVLTNVWKLQRDPAVWPNPTEYIPERFLGSHAHVDVKGGHFELIPFGAGRRMCPGVSFVLHVMHLTLARLIHGFELEMLPSAGSSQQEFAKSFFFRPEPFEVVVAPRLPSELYR